MNAEMTTLFGECLRQYCVVYLSPGGIHYRYRCSAKNKREAREMCRKEMFCSDVDITDVYEE